MVWYFAMAALAGDARVDMGPVVEEDVIRQGVDPLPAHRFAGVGDPSQLLDGGPVSPGHLVTTHAEVHARNARMPGSVDARVAVPALGIRRVPACSSWEKGMGCSGA